MAEEIVFEDGRISNFEGLVILTLDRAILHTVMHHSSTSAYVLNFNEIKETGRTDGHNNYETGCINNQAEQANKSRNEGMGWV